MEIRTGVRLTIILGALALIAACGGDAPEDTPPASVIETPAQDATPEAPIARFSYHTCPFGPPEGQVDGSTIACGTLEVPERRDVPDSRKIDLEVAVLRATGPIEEPDPIIYLAGGPGGRALDNDLSMFTLDFAAPLQLKRDIVFFDQRGAGYSRPSLSCGEFDFLYQVLKYSRSEDSQGALAECRDRLRDMVNVDLDAYNSVENAADIIDLARALGYEQYNLYGVSYGTRLALTAMRDAPAMIRSVVLDSTVPLQANLYSELGAGFEGSLNRFLDACAADRACRSFAPDLRGTLNSVLARLEAQPAFVPILDFGTGTTYNVGVDGGAFLNLLFGAFYSTDVIREVPRGILQVARGDYRMITTLASYSSRNAGDAVGMYLSVQCREEGPFNSIENVVPVRTFPVLSEAEQGDVASILADCATWAVAPGAPLENAPTVSDLPTLVLAGQFDPITPPSQGYRAAETLSRSTVVEFPGYGHGVLSEGCAMTLMAAFIDNPSTPVDAACVAGMGPATFTAPN